MMKYELTSKISNYDYYGYYEDFYLNSILIGSIKYSKISGGKNQGCYIIAASELQNPMNKIFYEIYKHVYINNPHNRKTLSQSSISPDFISYLNQKLEKLTSEQIFKIANTKYTHVVTKAQYKSICNLFTEEIMENITMKEFIDLLEYFTYTKSKRLGEGAFMLINLVMEEINKCFKYLYENKKITNQFIVKFSTDKIYSVGYKNGRRLTEEDFDLACQIMSSNKVKTRCKYFNILK